MHSPPISFNLHGENDDWGPVGDVGPTIIGLA